MTVYYVVQHQHDYEHHTGLKDITLYRVQDGGLHEIGDLTIDNTESTEEAILDYLGDFDSDNVLMKL